MNITPFTPLTPLLNPITPMETSPNVNSGDSPQKAGQDFSQFLKAALSEVDALQKKAETASLQLATGQVEDLSSVMIALEKANLSLSLIVVTRDKVLDAYHEVMRMQI